MYIRNTGQIFNIFFQWSYRGYHCNMFQLPLFCTSCDRILKYSGVTICRQIYQYDLVGLKKSGEWPKDIRGGFPPHCPVTKGRTANQKEASWKMTFFSLEPICQYAVMPILIATPTKKRPYVCAVRILKNKHSKSCESLNHSMARNAFVFAFVIVSALKMLK